jgi:hypothetical protein
MFLVRCDLAHQQGLKLRGSFALGEFLDHDADRHDALAAHQRFVGLPRRGHNIPGQAADMVRRHAVHFRERHVDTDIPQIAVHQGQADKRVGDGFDFGQTVAQRLLGLLAGRDVARDLRSAGDLSFSIVDRRDGNGQSDGRAVRVQGNGFGVFNGLAGGGASKHGVFFVAAPFRRVID